MEFKNLFSSIDIRGMKLKNRIVMTAMHLGYTPDGEVTDRLIRFYEDRARGGVGLIIVGGCPVDDFGGMDGMTSLNHARFIPGLKKLTNAIKENGAKTAAQLYQPGRYAHSSMIGGKRPFSASAVESKLTRETPRVLELDEIPQIQDSFAEAAVRAQKAGFDAVEVLGSAGYLIPQFFSPLTNLRTDKYGGSIENRMRFGIEVVEKVRNKVGPDYPIIMRLAGNDFMDGGNTNREAKVFARELEQAGIDLFNVTGGWHETRIPQITMFVPRKAFSYLAQGIKSAVSVPVIMSNRINDPYIAEKILRDGESDLVTMARALIADPELPNKTKEGRVDQIYHCVACNQGCFDRILSYKPAACLVNPRAGLEKETEIVPAAKVKKVLVVGGGPAGMKAACTAAQRGHNVTLVDKSSRLGGQLLLNKEIPGRKEMVNVAKDLVNNLHALAVNVILNKQVDASFVREMAPDAAVLATGAIPMVPEINGIENERVVLAWDVLSGKAEVSEKVVIVGGNAVGLETALYLGNQGTISPEVLHFLAANKAETWETLELLINKGNKEVTVVEMMNKAGKDIGGSTRWTVMSELRRLGIKVLTKTEAVEITNEGLKVQKESGDDLISADSIVIAAGSRAVEELSGVIRNLVPEVYIIGDAKKPRTAMDAIQEGFKVGLDI
jgi:2,4-dienoyl-CoA reductase (NADPH2)